MTKAFNFNPEDEVRMRGMGVVGSDTLSEETSGDYAGSTVERLVKRNWKLMEQRVVAAEEMATLRCELKQARDLLWGFVMLAVGLVAILAWRCL